MAKDTFFYKKRTIRCNSRIIELDKPLVMGILNLTPDSFYDGGKYTTPKSLHRHLDQMITDGADIIDVGGYSSRPGAADVPQNIELERIEPALEFIRTRYPDAIISIDTFRAGVASALIEKYKVDLINDITAGIIEPEILDVVAENQVAYIAMHMQGTPQNMQQAPHYEHIVTDIIDFFSNRLAVLQQKKINDIVIDPGFGFGKTLEQNYQLLAGLDNFRIFEFPVLAGLSRKSMIYKQLGSGPEEALAGTIALNTIALQMGTSILRVHDVKEAKHTIDIYEKLKAESEKSINLLTSLKR